MATLTDRPATVDDRYLELVRGFPLRPLRSDEDLRRAIEVIDGLIDRPSLTPAEGDYLDVLGDIVSRFEAVHVPMPPLSDADLLRHMIGHRGLTQAEVSAGSGIAESTLSQVLAGKRGLNRGHIEALCRFFKVGPAAFMAG